MQRLFKPAIAALGLVIAVGAPASWVTAHVGATGIVKERMDVMKGMAEAMKVMGAMVKGETPFEPAVIADKAGYLAEHANRIPEMTPEGSNDHPSEALPAIWQSWDDYVADADELAIEGAKLVEIATNGADEAAMKAQYLKVGKTCGTCHDRFRKPKD